MATDPQTGIDLTTEQVILIVTAAAVGGTVSGLLHILSAILGEAKTKVLLSQVLHEAAANLLNLRDPAGDIHH